MAPRLNKRQQREHEELELLAGPSFRPEDEASDEDELELPSRGGFAATSVYDFLQNKKKKKKSTISSSQNLPSTVVRSPPSPEASSPTSAVKTSGHATPRSEKKVAKKAKAKARKSEADEIDQALAELSLKHPELPASTVTATTSTARTALQTLATLLSVSAAHLDPDAELRKFFGAKVIQASKTDATGSRRHRTERSCLTRPQDTWWPSQLREGLSIRQLSPEERTTADTRHGWTGALPGEKWWTVEYSQRYKSVTKGFMQIVMSASPDGFDAVLQRLCWHADTLLQLSEVYRHREEYATSVDFVDRAIFTYERALLGAFNFSTGNNRLDFDRVESRPFFLAIHRQTTDLQRRGCFRTAFEFARLLYSLDPWTDPHGALLHLEFLALRSGMEDWLLRVWDAFTMLAERDPSALVKRANPTLLPGWSYSHALALHMMEKKKHTSHDESTAALVEAMHSFPSVVPFLADKLDVQLPQDMLLLPEMEILTRYEPLLGTSQTMIHMLSRLYAQRSHTVWKEYSAWFLSTAIASFPAGTPVQPTPRRHAMLALYSQTAPLRYAVFRHIMVLGPSCRSLLAFFPQSITRLHSYACDLLPPPTSLSRYNQAYFMGVRDIGRSRREREADDRRVAQIIPDPVLRRRMQLWFDENPDVVPGGFLQFARLAAFRPQEEFDDFLAGALGQWLNRPAGNAGGMPGQMPGDEPMVNIDELPNPQVDFAGAEDRAAAEPPFQINDDEEIFDEENVKRMSPRYNTDLLLQPLPVRVIRNLLGMFWGGGAATQEDESSNDEGGAA
ncbi:DUF654-domain-containing protein [Fistulina hepatica ATCC 64428]|uniref:DUF654-domain-containing protein n=1 Tax=Fistulina hepatica ATCC 64428 TaxID=1128425 RepID=A0A0D7ADS0_9AGAR|nr:DUF654-domain-containing protein [Fistulina hepatica ATCC 64428]